MANDDEGVGLVQLGYVLVPAEALIDGSVDDAVEVVIALEVLHIGVSAGTLRGSVDFGPQPRLEGFLVDIRAVLRHVCRHGQQQRPIEPIEPRTIAQPAEVGLEAYRLPPVVGWQVGVQCANS